MSVQHLPKLARAFNDYLIGTSIQPLTFWHECSTLTQIRTSVQCFPNWHEHLTLRKKKNSIFNAYHRWPHRKNKDDLTQKMLKYPNPKKEKKLKMHWSYFATPRVLHIPAVAIFFCMYIAWVIKSKLLKTWSCVFFETPSILADCEFWYNLLF